MSKIGPKPSDQRSVGCILWLFHNWEPWSGPYQSTWSNQLGQRGKGWFQTKVCANCGIVKVRKV